MQTVFSTRHIYYILSISGNDFLPVADHLHVKLVVVFINVKTIDFAYYNE
jgi:hypothetical protein